MNKNKTMEIASFTGIITVFAAGFFVYTNILVQLANFITSLQASIFNY